MALVFDDENEVICPKCSSNIFKEVEIFCLDKRVDNVGDVKYVKIQPTYNIVCNKCETIIDTSLESKIKEV